MNAWMHVTGMCSSFNLKHFIEVFLYLCKDASISINMQFWIQNNVSQLYIYFQ